MTRKRELRERIAELEMELTLARIGPPPTFDTLTVCWAQRTVTFRGKTITTESDCVTFPVTSDQHLLERQGWR